MNDSTAATPIKTGIGATDGTNNAVACTENVTVNSKQPKGWRGHLKVHPAAELLPPMSDAELRELADDIEANGLREPMTVHDDPRIGECILDGRNRLDALEILGREIVTCMGHLAPRIFARIGASKDFNPRSFVISKNIRRRHLTAEQKRGLIGELIKLNPAKSDRQIARTAGVDNKTVAAERARAERREEIPHVKTRTDSKGRKQPARKPTKAKDSAAARRPAIDLVTYDLANLKSAMAEVEAQALASNTTRVKEALRALRRETDRALEADCISTTPPPGDLH